jgi:predicted transcriptional regulator
MCLEILLVGMEEEAYSDGTPLVELFGEAARVKMLSVFATQREREFNVAELSRQAGITRKTAYDYIDQFAHLGIIQEREVSQGKRYSYNADSDVARKLYELNGAILQRRLELQEDTS